MARMNEARNIELDVFLRGVRLVLGDADFLREDIKETFKDDEETVNELMEKVDEYEKNSNGMALLSGSGESIVNVRHGIDNSFDIGTLVHEMAHATFHVMRFMNIPINEDTEEVFCYTQTHLVTKSLDWAWEEETEGERINILDVMIKDTMDNTPDGWTGKLTKTRLRTLLGLVKDAMTEPSEAKMEEIIHMLYYLPNERSERVAP